MPEWLEEENAVPVEWMTGFRQSFRTAAIQEVGFDSAFVNYGQFEDVAASFAVARRYLLVGARNAQVFHYRHPAARADGIGMGVRQILDRAYIICRYATHDSRAVQRLKPYAYYKMAQYLLGIHSKYGRGRLLGAWKATKRIPRLINVPEEQMKDLYERFRDECMGNAGER